MLESLPPEEQDEIAADILETLDQAELEAVQAIRVGIRAVEERRVRPAREALKELQNTLGIPD